MDKTKGMVSIILPVFNRQDFIEECINSVLAQSYQNFEIVIVDDGSSDNTFEICQNLAVKEPRIQLYRPEHGGVSAARNFALKVASGEFVFFLDSDDVIYPCLLETLVLSMQKHNAAISGTCVHNVQAQRWEHIIKALLTEPQIGETAFLTHSETLDAVFHSRTPLDCIGGVMMRSDLIGTTEFHTDLYIGEDFYFIYENLIKGASSVFLKQKWYFARNHKHNISKDYSFDGFWTRFYRRVLVWRNEDALGRKEYADIQKRDAFGCFTRCFNHNPLSSSDSKRMRKALKEYKAELLPAFSRRVRLIILLYIYFPSLAVFVQKTKRLFLNFKNNKQANESMNQ